MIIFLIFAQFSNIFISYLLSKKYFSYLVLCNLIFLLILTGSIVNEVKIYNKHDASIYLLLFNFFLNLGALSQNLFTGGRLKKAIRYRAENITIKPLVNEIDRKIVLLALISFIAVALLFFLIYGVPLFFEDLQYARKEIQGDGIAHIFYRFFLYFIPITSAILYTRYRAFHCRRDLNLFRFSFIITSLILLALGYKGFVLWYVVFIVMLINMYSEDILKYALTLGVFGILAGIIATTFMYSFTVTESLELLLARSTQVAAYGYNIVFYELYPQLRYVTIEGSNLNQFLSGWKFGQDSKMAEHGLGITTTIVGALLMIFGKTGTLLSATIIGFVMQYLYFLAFKYKISPLFGVFYLYLTFTFIGVVARGTVKIVFIQPILSLCLLVLFYILLESILKGHGKYKFNRVQF